MSTMPKQRFTPQEYLARERVALDKHEYYQGEIFAMSGASKEHVRISGNIYRRLANQLDGHPCEPFNSDMRVKVSATGLYTYPDITVACDPAFEDAHVDVLLNPKVIIEVLSRSTWRHDREWKFRHYQQLPSVEGIIFVAQDAPSVEHFIRQEGALWLFANAYSLESTLAIDSIGCQLPLAQIYQGVEFPPPPTLEELSRR